MWSIIENLLSEMRQKTIEEYYAVFVRVPARPSGRRAGTKIEAAPAPKRCGSGC